MTTKPYVNCGSIFFLKLIYRRKYSVKSYN